MDIALAGVGPGMAIFSRHEKVLEPDGSDTRVGAALALINQALDEAMAERESTFDAETRWAAAWFDLFSRPVSLMDLIEYTHGISQLLGFIMGEPAGEVSNLLFSAF